MWPLCFGEIKVGCNRSKQVNKVANILYTTADMNGEVVSIKYYLAATILMFIIIVLNGICGLTVHHDWLKKAVVFIQLL